MRVQFRSVTDFGVVGLRELLRVYLQERSERRLRHHPVLSIPALTRLVHVQRVFFSITVPQSE